MPSTFQNFECIICCWTKKRTKNGIATTFPLSPFQILCQRCLLDHINLWQDVKIEKICFIWPKRIEITRGDHRQESTRIGICVFDIMTAPQSIVLILDYKLMPENGSFIKTRKHPSFRPLLIRIMSFDHFCLMVMQYLKKSCLYDHISSKTILTFII